MNKGVTLTLSLSSYISLTTTKVGRDLKLNYWLDVKERYANLDPGVLNSLTASMGQILA